MRAISIQCEIYEHFRFSFPLAICMCDQCEEKNMKKFDPVGYFRFLFSSKYDTHLSRYKKKCPSEIKVHNMYVSHQLIYLEYHSKLSAWHVNSLQIFPLKLKNTF